MLIIYKRVLAQSPAPASCISLKNLKITRNAEFSKVADSIADIAEGASACASGNQEWTGAKPTFVPKPITIKINDSFSQKGFIK